MLGLILNVFCNRLVRCYGETVAEQVLECCGWDPADRGCAPFSVWQYYPDAAFFALVDAAHKLGHASVADLMEGLGSHFATTVSGACAACTSCFSVRWYCITTDVVVRAQLQRTMGG